MDKRPETIPTVLQFPDAERPGAPRQGLLWPAWQWEVIVPRRSSGRDLIECAVLGLLATRWRSIEQLADVLALDPGVIELVLERLEEDELIGPDAVTRAGVAQIDEGGRHARLAGHALELAQQRRLAHAALPVHVEHVEREIWGRQGVGEPRTLGLTPDEPCVQILMEAIAKGQPGSAQGERAPRLWPSNGGPPRRVRHIP